MYKTFEKEWINYYLKSILDFKIKNGYFEFENPLNSKLLTFKEITEQVKDVPWYKFGNEEDRNNFIRYKYRKYFINNVWKNREII